MAQLGIFNKPSAVLELQLEVLVEDLWTAFQDHSQAQTLVGDSLLLELAAGERGG